MGHQVLENACKERLLLLRGPGSRQPTQQSVRYLLLWFVRIFLPTVIAGLMLAHVDDLTNPQGPGALVEKLIEKLYASRCLNIIDCVGTLILPHNLSRCKELFLRHDPSFPLRLLKKQGLNKTWLI
ncbi:hypothetical protein I7I50_00423 [Histoplasma capsulatum G186AR]|uniref:Uncharacterized protein n=1 Tax=Ajellomyces capsulatus TaxID=5037 RepID=A0A8H7YDZ0_AJECA|nr:hypothetical protein I7I52_07691 [Histoplasma capsulatum]QSS72548.1 hypothetical protein I7I50_00423 [Histoplasma capsulatum G186AR]